MISVREGAQFMEFTDDDLEGGTDVRGFVVPESVPASNSELAAAIEQIRPDHGADMVILAADHTVAVQLLRLTVALGKSALLTERLIDAMFVPGSTASPAAAHQAQRNAMARQALIDEFGLHSADEIAELSGSTASNRSATASPVLAAFEPYGLDGWEVALWFTTGSGWLDDERPVDLLTRAPERVTAAAEHAFEEPVG
jgi:hypothetical protein